MRTKALLSIAAFGLALAAGPIVSVFAQTSTMLAPSSTSAQTSTSSSSSNKRMNQADITASTTPAPGVPNTGSGGDAATNVATLALSAIVATGGFIYLRRKLQGTE